MFVRINESGGRRYLQIVIPTATRPESRGTGSLPISGASMGWKTATSTR